MYGKWPNFDELKKVAENNPEKLEEFRAKQIEQIINHAPQSMRERLRGLQFQINCQREIHKTPLGACIAISKMMRDSLGKLNTALNDEHDLDEFDDREMKEDNIVPFGG